MPFMSFCFDSELFFSFQRYDGGGIEDVVVKNLSLSGSDRSPNQQVVFFSQRREALLKPWLCEVISMVQRSFSRDKWLLIVST